MASTGSGGACSGRRPILTQTARYCLTVIWTGLRSRTADLCANVSLTLCRIAHENNRQKISLDVVYPDVCNEVTIWMCDALRHAKIWGVRVLTK